MYLSYIKHKILQVDEEIIQLAAAVRAVDEHVQKDLCFQLSTSVVMPLTDSVNEEEIKTLEQRVDAIEAVCTISPCSRP